MPKTVLLDASNPADIYRAAELLRAGKTVGFPTETVYGLGANALSSDAVEEIFIAKQRPSWDPLIVHIQSAADLAAITVIPPHAQPRVEALAKAFWPGPLTLLLPRSAKIPDAVTAGRALVGVRVPSHRTAQYLLQAAQIPIAAPSANTFGHTSPTTAAHVLADLDGRIAAVLDDGPSPVGIESTVLDPCRTPMVLYRPGAVTEEQIVAVTGVAVQLFAPAMASMPREAMPSPGVGIRHYAPRARMVLIEGTPQALLQAQRQEAERGEGSVGVILPTGWPAVDSVLQEAWADWDDPNALAAMLFASMRALDDRGVKTMLCPKPAPGGVADAILDRLHKSAREA
ncbi:MAG: L-threonylcarbamoyladenylate synthase [Bryocella sp.]